MTDVSPDSFRVKTLSPDGEYTEGEHGVKMEAVKFTSAVTDENNSWMGQSRTYANTYSKPVVIGQVMSYNDPDWSVFWARGSSRSALTAVGWLGSRRPAGAGEFDVGFTAACIRPLLLLWGHRRARWLRVVP